MLKSIFIVTMLVTRLADVESAYHEHLGYQSIERGAVSEEIAQVWAAPAMAGRRFVLMGPASGSEVYLRFIEDPSSDEAPAPLTTHGWGATELLVTDPDELAWRLERSPFTVIGPPQDLYPAPKAPRAMQLRGPADEILYMTRPIPGGSRYDLGVASSFVDRSFIVVVGGPSMTDLRGFYGEVLGLVVGAPTPFTIGVLTKANGLPADTQYSLAMVQLSPGFLIELDEYPAGTRRRPIASGHLPPRMAMVSFLADSLETRKVVWRAAPRQVQALPYAGRRTAVTVGPAGEWIEVVERATR
jgi:hypothetical protein